MVMGRRLAKHLAPSHRHKSRGPGRQCLHPLEAVAATLFRRPLACSQRRITTANRGDKLTSSASGGKNARTFTYQFDGRLLLDLFEPPVSRRLIYGNFY